MVLGIVIMFVCLSDTHLVCDETKEDTADILTLHERAIANFHIPTEVGERRPILS